MLRSYFRSQQGELDEMNVPDNDSVQRLIEEVLRLQRMTQSLAAATATTPGSAPVAAAAAAAPVSGVAEAGPPSAPPSVRSLQSLGNSNSSSYDSLMASMAPANRSIACNAAGLSHQHRDDLVAAEASSFRPLHQMLPPMQQHERNMAVLRQQALGTSSHSQYSASMGDPMNSPPVGFSNALTQMVPQIVPVGQVVYAPVGVSSSHPSMAPATTGLVYGASSPMHSNLQPSLLHQSSAAHNLIHQQQQQQQLLHQQALFPHMMGTRLQFPKEAAAGFAGAAAVSSSSGSNRTHAHAGRDLEDDEEDDQSGTETHQRQHLLTTNVGPGAFFRAKKRRRYRHESFPEKLYRMLDDTAKAGKEEVVGFTKSGKAFEIHRTDEFLQEIIPEFFRHKSISSFRRQLSMYGFRRVKDGPDHGAYSHELFRRGRPELCRQMKRVAELELILPNAAPSASSPSTSRRFSK